MLKIIDFFSNIYDNLYPCVVARYLSLPVDLLFIHLIKPVFIYIISLFKPIFIMFSYIFKVPNLFNNILPYSLTSILGISTVFILVVLFIFFTMLDSPTLIGLVMKLMLFLMISVLYLLVLNLDPWSCFMVVIFVPSIFLLSVVLNSVRYVNNISMVYLLYKWRFFNLIIFILFLIYSLPIQNIDCFYQNLYTKNNSYSNLDFLGFSILLFNNSIIIPLVITKLTYVSLIIILRFKLEVGFSNFKMGNWLLNYLNSRVFTDYFNLIDDYFLNKKPILSRFFRFKKN